MQTARLEKWQKMGQVLVGTVYDHPKVTDGRVIMTSKIVDYQPNLGYCVTKNTKYYLGEMTEIAIEKK